MIARLLGGREVGVPLQVFILCVAVILPVLAFTGFTLQRYAQSESQRTYEAALDSARLLINTVDRDLEGKLSGLEVLALSGALERGDYEAFHTQALRAQEIFAAPIIFVDRGGLELIDTTRPYSAARTVRLEEDQVQALEGQVAVSNLMQNTATGEWFLRLSEPVRRDGDVTGVLSMSLTSSSLSSLLLQAQLPESWTLAVVDSNGVIIARSKDQERFVGTLATEDLRRNTSGAEGSWRGTTASGQSVLSAYARSSLLDWRVAVGIPAALVDDPLRSSVLSLIGVGLLGLGISVAVALLFGSPLASAMSNLARVAADPTNADRSELPITPIREVNAVGMAMVNSARRLRLEADARDVAERRLEDERSRLERILHNSPVGIIEAKLGGVVFANQTAIDLLGLEPGEEGTYRPPQFERQSLGGETLPVEADPTARALGGESVRGAELTVVFPELGRKVDLSVNSAPIVRDGAVVGAVSSFIDISERASAESELKLQSEMLRVLNETGAAIAAELELEKLVQMVTDAGVRLTGAEFGAFFYNTVNEQGEILTLYTISGVPREHFSRFPMPRNTNVFAPTFKGDGVVRSADITKDERYGHNTPHNGMPEGHLPVRSYLAVPVIGRAGEVIGGLFFGHPEPDRFTERHETLLLGIAGQAATGIDNARLFEEARNAREALLGFNRSLEAEVLARTEELTDANRKLLQEIAQRETAEEQLRQAQKMEAVGQLTGGIAHDFNNLLAIIVGSLDILGRRIEKGRTEDARRFVDAALEGAQRAASLTQRLLAFARRQPLSPEPINPNKLVSDVSELLRRTIPQDISIEVVLGAGLWRAHADRNQLENAIVNLAVNARDAMPDGGRLTIETGNFDLDERYVADHPGISPGQYVLVAVSDTGSGMSKEVMERAFDPFFTTKEAGKGTGLGLSQIYGFVRQTGGHVKIYSELGQGTTVKMYLPRFSGGEAEKVPADTANETPRGSETILLVEDEEAVRLTSSEALKELGYRVLEAANAAEALRLLDGHPEVILLFTDIVMPDINGRRLADEALHRRPDLKVLFTSGYTRNAIVHNGVLDAGVQLLVKPFTIDQLGRKLRDIIDVQRGGE
jgi:PAS domain S-box-containing protein